MQLGRRHAHGPRALAVARVLMQHGNPGAAECGAPSTEHPGAVLGDGRVRVREREPLERGSGAERQRALGHAALLVYV